MRKMSVFELLFALLLVCLVAAVAVVGALVWSLVRRSEGQARDVGELKARLVAGGQTQDSQSSALRDGLSHTQTVVEGLRSALAARQAMEEQDRAALRRMEHILAGSSTRGAAGEHILEEALRHLPPEMLQRNVWVAGKVVELALRLPGGKLLPIDSKWVSSPALEQLADTGLDARWNGGSRRSASTSTRPSPLPLPWPSSPTRLMTSAAAPSSTPTTGT
jgi:hypothetical protein